MGAGLGGGSSDAAEIIQLINRLFNLDISEQELNGYALELGSDCPFFMQSAPLFCYRTWRNPGTVVTGSFRIFLSAGSSGNPASKQPGLIPELSRPCQNMI